jgi:hypothetical protein
MRHYQKKLSSRSEQRPHITHSEFLISWYAHLQDSNASSLGSPSSQDSKGTNKDDSEETQLDTQATQPMTLPIMARTLSLPVQTQSMDALAGLETTYKDVQVFTSFFFFFLEVLAQWITSWQYFDLYYWRFILICRSFY